MSRRAKFLEALTELLLGIGTGCFALAGLLTGKIPYPSRYSFGLPEAELALNPEGFWYSLAFFSLGSLFLLTAGFFSMRKVIYRGPERLEH